MRTSNKTLALASAGGLGLAAAAGLALTLRASPPTAGPGRLPGHLYWLDVSDRRAAGALAAVERHLRPRTPLTSHFQDGGPAPHAFDVVRETRVLAHCSQAGRFALPLRGGPGGSAETWDALVRRCQAGSKASACPAVLAAPPLADALDATWKSADCSAVAAPPDDYDPDAGDPLPAAEDGAAR